MPTQSVFKYMGQGSIGMSRGKTMKGGGCWAHLIIKNVMQVQVYESWYESCDL